MSNFVTGKHSVVADLCRSFGLNPALVHKLSFVAEAGKVVFLDVIMYADEATTSNAAKLIARRFYLVEAPETKEPVA